MSVCYSYLVKATYPLPLFELLEAEAVRSGRVYPLESSGHNTSPKVGFFNRFLNGLGVKRDKTCSSAVQGSVFCQKISAQALKREKQNVCIDVDIPWSWTEKVLEPTSWYYISTTFTTAKDSHLVFAQRLSVVCEKVSLQSECDHSPGVNTFWFLEHLTEE